MADSACRFLSHLTNWLGWPSSASLASPQLAKEKNQSSTLQKEKKKELRHQKQEPTLTEEGKLRNSLKETKQKLEVAKGKSAELLAKIDALEKQYQPERTEQVVRKELLVLKSELK